MDIEFECTSCDSRFQRRIAQVLKDGYRLRCPECGETCDESSMESFRENFEGLAEAMSEIRDSFRFTVTLDTEELPAPFGDRDEELEEENDSDDEFPYDDER